MSSDNPRNAAQAAAALRRPAGLRVSIDATSSAADPAALTATAGGAWLLPVADDEGHAAAAAMLMGGFATVASAMPQLSTPAQPVTAPTPHTRWLRAAAKARASSGAADMTAAARLKNLQRTPFPMVVARMKVLLERLHTLVHDFSPVTAAAAAAAAPGSQQHRPFPTQLKRPASATSATASQSLVSSNPSKPLNKAGAGAPKTPGSGTKTPPSGARTPGSRGAGFKGMSEPSTGGVAESIVKLSVQTVLEELEVMFGFVSEFLGKLPTETRLALATVARLESYKKDQIIYDVGQQAENFYIILAGRIDIWSHPPGVHRPKSVVSVLHKGEAFGDQAIINGARHSTAASPGSNASLLVVSKEDFLSVFGTYFQDVAASWQAFLMSSVAPLADAQPSEVQRLCSAMVSSKPAAGKDWNLQQDQIFFVKEGTFQLQLIDLEAQKAADAAFASAMAATSAIAATAEPAAASSATPDPAAAPGVEEDLLAAAAAAATQSSGAAGSAFGGLGGGVGLSLGDLPTLATRGVLANVSVRDGRAVGTLGVERELRKHRQASVPRKAVAVLGPGSWFGGGAAIYGSGHVQSALRVVAKGSGCELIHVHLDGVAQHGGEALIKRLRDDAAFKLTYYLGRLGILPPATAIGHPESSLLSSTAAGSPVLSPVAAAAAGAASMASTAHLAGMASGPGRASITSIPNSPKGVIAAFGARQSVAAAAGTAGFGAAAAAAADTGSPGLMQHGRFSVASFTTSMGVAAAVLHDAALNTRMGQAAVENAAGTAAAAAVAAAGLQSTTAASGSTVRRTGRHRQKYVHVPGSGVYSPGTMAALQHIQSLQAASLPDKPHPHHAQQDSSVPSAAPVLTVPSAAAPGAGSSSSSRPSSARLSIRPSSSKPSSSLGQARASVARVSSSGSILLSAAAVADAAGDADASKLPGNGAAGGAVTAAERYWAQPDHNSTAAAAALSPLLSSLFTDGLQPLVQEIDGLISHAETRGYKVPQLATYRGPSEQVHLQQQQQQQQQQQRRPSSALGRLQQTAVTSKTGGEGVSDVPGAYGGAGCTGSISSSIEAAGRVQSGAAGRLQVQNRPRSAVPAAAWKGQSLGAGRRPSTAGSSAPGAGSSCVPVSADVLQHKPYSNLLAATVMWQRSSELSFRPPLRQCLTTSEIEEQARVK